MTPGRLNIASNYLDKPTKMAHHGCIKPNLWSLHGLEVAHDDPNTTLKDKTKSQTRPNTRQHSPGKASKHTPKMNSMKLPPLWLWNSLKKSIQHYSEDRFYLVFPAFFTRRTRRRLYATQRQKVQNLPLVQEKRIFLERTWIPANPPKRQFYRNLQCFAHVCSTGFEVQKSKMQSSWRIWKIWSRAKEYRKTNNATCHFGKACQAYTRSTRVFGFVLFTASACAKTLFLIMTPGRLNIASNYLDKPTKMAHHGCAKPNL